MVPNTHGHVVILTSRTFTTVLRFAPRNLFGNVIKASGRETTAGTVAAAASANTGGGRASARTVATYLKQNSKLLQSQVPLFYTRRLQWVTRWRSARRLRRPAHRPHPANPAFPLLRLVLREDARPQAQLGSSASTG